MTTLDDYCKKLHHMFYVDYPYEEKDNVEKLFKDYFTAGVIGYEKSDKGIEHIQCYCIGTKAKYNSFIAKWKKEYEIITGEQPTGRASKGERRNYGRVKGLKKEPKYAIAYCMKDGEYKHWGIDEDIIKICEEITYKPEKIKDKYEEMIEFCKKNKEIWRDYKIAYLGKVVKEHFRLYKTALTKRTLDKYLLAAQVVSYEEYATAQFGFYNQCYQ